MKRIFLLTLLIPGLLFGSAKINIISPIAGGSGTYASPYIIDGNVVKWRCEVTGHEGSYKTNVHLTGHRSCGTALANEGLSIAEVNTLTFVFTDICGKYYLCIKDDSGELTREFIYLRSPPLRLEEDYDKPYVYPADNSPAKAIIIVDNQVSGSGTDGDPVKIDGSIIKFYMKSQDSDGNTNDGVRYWAIQPPGGVHPVYMNGSGVSNSRDCYAFGSDMDKLQEYDTLDASTFLRWIELLFEENRLGADELFTLWVIAIDSDGAWSEASIKFKVNGDDDSPPSSPKNARIEVL